MRKEDYVNAWKERVSETASHLKLQGHYFSTYKENVINYIPETGLKIIDFGCGGGWLGVLCKKLGRDYLGLDISERSYKKAKENNVSVRLIDPYRLSAIKTKKNDVIVSLSVIQHFPTLRYLDYFLKWCDQSGAKRLVLQIRYAEDTHVAENPYDKMDDIIFCCYTNGRYVTMKLGNYTLCNISAVGRSSGYQYLYYRRKE